MRGPEEQMKRRPRSRVPPGAHEELPEASQWARVIVAMAENNLACFAKPASDNEWLDGRRRAHRTRERERTQQVKKRKEGPKRRLASETHNLCIQMGPFASARGCPGQTEKHKWGWGPLYLVSHGNYMSVWQLFYYMTLFSEWVYGWLKFGWNLRRLLKQSLLWFAF